MRDRNYLCPAFELVMLGGVEHVGDQEVQPHPAAVFVNASPTIAVGLEMFLKRIEGSTARRQSTGTGRIGAPSHPTSIVMSLGSQQGDRLRQHVGTL